MSALVIPFTSYHWSGKPGICIHCDACGDEWGWMYDDAGNYRTLSRWAKEHNDAQHPTPPTDGYWETTGNLRVWHPHKSRNYGRQEA